MSEPFNRTAAGKGYGKAFNKAQLSIPGVAQRIKSIPVFDKIRCKTCREMRKKELYSENQLNELRYKIYQGGKQVNQFNAMIKCKMCTGLQPNEMLCSVCTEIKMLNDFAKAQRRNPDSARCKVCIQHIAETEPGLEVLSQRNNDSDSDSDSDFSGEEYDMSIALNNSLQGLQIQAGEPSDDTSVSGSKSNTSLPEDKNGALEGKRALHGSIISKTGSGSINTMTAPYGKESEGAIRAGSVASNASFFGGGVALPNDAGKKKSAAIRDRDDLQNNGTFPTAFDNEGWAYVSRADRSRRGGKSVSESSEVSKGGWGKVKKTDNSGSTWVGGNGPTPAKPSEPFQKMPAATFFKKGSGRVIGVDEGDDGLLEL
ncbi:MAG: hypothetical protein M1839_000515 [Geoglossum umbratile]|nr:MAG: hypothetical protein M1839_000515 [Geoglossum umbratile]